MLKMEEVFLMKELYAQGLIKYQWCGALYLTSDGKLIPNGS